ncbi:PxKF domain-containing protein [Streptomyces sp. NPDC050516]|uniref:PxKF domain-containing protein n=1 Tax=Streptomyces sp. NPDC050516 TaxID=3365621 RepID=UPI003793DEDA
MTSPSTSAARPRPSPQGVGCTTGAPTGPLEPTAATTALTYDLGADRYTYTWKTDTAWANTCRERETTGARRSGSSRPDPCPAPARSSPR